MTTLSAGEMQKVVDDLGLGTRVMLDTNRDAFRLYGVSGVPAIFLHDAQGVFRHTKLGWGPGSLDTMKQWVEQLSPEENP